VVADAPAAQRDGRRGVPVNPLHALLRTPAADHGAGRGHCADAVRAVPLGRAQGTPRARRARRRAHRGAAVGLALQLVLWHQRDPRENAPQYRGGVVGVAGALLRVRRRRARPNAGDRDVV